MRGQVLMFCGLLLAPPAVAEAQGVAPSANLACVGNGVQALAGFVIEDQPPADGDLPSLLVTDSGSNANLTIFYQPDYEEMARSRAACLGVQLALLQHWLGDDRRGVEWDSVVFARSDYVSPRDGGPPRWLATQGDETDAFVARTMPHEQVHRFQKRNGAVLPRWFAEGHAVWVAGHVIPALRPDLAAVEVAELDAALAELDGTPALRNWGAVRVKREAIWRQVPPDMQARMDADPTFSPPGPFSFGPGDIESDQSNTVARYAAAARIFAGIEMRHGAGAVQRWVSDLTASQGSVPNSRILESAQERLGQDLSHLLE